MSWLRLQKVHAVFTWGAGLAGGLYAAHWSSLGLAWLALAISGLLGVFGWLFRQECEPWTSDPVRAELELVRCDRGALRATILRLERELDELRQP